MINWQQLLRDGDAAADRLSAEAASRLREVVVHAARSTPTSGETWPMRLALGVFAGVVVMLALAGRGQPPIDPLDSRSPTVAGTERRQIQFSTPGGTRIIWELNPNFTLGETIP